MDKHGQSPGSPWPDSGDSPILFLLDADNGIERRLLQQWIGATREGVTDSVHTAQVALPILHGVRGRVEIGDLPDKLSTHGDTVIVPLRVVWLPRKTEGRSGPRFRDLFLGDPRHPSRLVAQMIMRWSPGRARCIVGKAATIDELRQQHGASFDVANENGDEEDFAAFVVRRAGLALDVPERRLQGNRYKVPRYVSDGLRFSSKFNRAMDELAKQLGKPVAELHVEARTYMKEMVAEPNAFFIDWMAKIARFVMALGYENEVVSDPADLERTRKILQEHPSALLWTHKSHVDGLAVVSVLYENDLPAPHSLGGINMAVTGLGYLGRKSGVIYIRRTFADNPVYKLVFRHYLGYLMEKRFPFSWAFEGTRSRVGKLMPPRYGLIKYIIEAAHATEASDLHFIPVSVSYDLIGEAGDYAREQSGQKKRPESLTWFLGYIRRLKAPMGRIYFDFCEPVVIKGKTPPPDEVDIAKTAFEVAVRVNSVTPVTFPSLACMVLLGAAPRALTVREFRSQLIGLIVWLRKRNTRMTDNFDEGKGKQLEELAQITIDRGIVSQFDEGTEPVYGIAEEKYAVAGYYRNTVAHYFVNKAIIELALVNACDVAPEERVDAFWAETDCLRDLFKFEFFYSPKNIFREQLAAELTLYSTEWEAAFCADAGAFIATLRPLVAHSTLLPYIEAYGVVAEVLDGLAADEGIEVKECVALALKYGQQRYLQQRISSKASIGKLLFENAHKLFDHKGLTTKGDTLVSAKRTAAAEGLAELSDRLKTIRSVAEATPYRRPDSKSKTGNGENGVTTT